VGMNGVPGAVNVLAAAVKAGMSVFDLEELELAYAPPFGAAKDPANMAGFVGSNWLRGDVEVVHWDEVKGLDPQKDLLLDVRTKPEWDVGYIPGTVHIPLQELRQRLAELPKDKRIVVYCKVGQRGYVAARILKAHGYHAVNLTGGMDTWQAATEKQSNFDAWQPKGAAGPAGAGAPAALTPAEVSAAVLVDACGLQCPGPIMQVYRTMQALQPGQVMKAVATDPGFARDIGSWCQSTGNELLEVKQEGAQFVAFVRKAGKPEGAPAVSKAAAAGPGERTLIVFSNDMDRALAAFILANGAAATGQKVTMFFTFWGLNLLRKPQAVAVKKNLIEKMFGLMMPRGAEATKLSKLNMLGAGTAMMKGVMRSKNIDSLPALMRSAQELGVRLIACQMTMDMMGIKPEELIEGIEIGGVATYTAVSDTAGVNLFV